MWKKPCQQLSPFFLILRHFRKEELTLTKKVVLCVISLLNISCIAITQTFGKSCVVISIAMPGQQNAWGGVSKFWPQPLVFSFLHSCECLIPLCWSHILGLSLSSPKELFCEESIAPKQGWETWAGKYGGCVQIPSPLFIGKVWLEWFCPSSIALFWLSPPSHVWNFLHF